MLFHYSRPAAAPHQPVLSLSRAHGLSFPDNVEGASLPQVHGPNARPFLEVGPFHEPAVRAGETRQTREKNGGVRKMTCPFTGPVPPRLRISLS